VRVCPFCGTENEVFFRFCLGCGADLDEALGGGPELSSPGPAAAGPPVVAREERVVEPEPLPATMVRHRQAPETSQRRRPATTSGEGKPSPATTRGRLVLILEDGTDGAVYELSPDKTVIGREGADISFPHDDFLAPRHAELIFQGHQLTINPLESTNGVFMQVSHEVELRTNDVFRIGQELLRFELLSDVVAREPETRGGVLKLGSPMPEGAWGRLAQLLAPDAWGAVYLLGGSDIYLGRERGDITFPGDGFVSGLHAVVMQRDERYFLKDLGSSNGTYYRLRRPTPLRKGALVLAGQQLFRVEV